MMNWFSSKIRVLYAPVDVMPLAVFRMAFGIIMLWEVWRYFRYDRISRYYIEPDFHFKYYGFEWLHPLPGDGMFMVFHFLGLLSALILFGLAYRISMTLFWLTFTYIFLLDQAQYLNHFYLISLISFLMIFVPAHRTLSLDALIRSALRSDTVPLWSLWLLRGQMAIVYTFGGLAKINPDWLRGEPMRRWLAARDDFPVIGQLFHEEWMVYAFSCGGMLYDLLIVPLILWPRTRFFALGLTFVFHLTNFRLFNIGVFPWFSIAITFLFLPAHWFRFKFKAPVLPKTLTLPPLTARHWALMGVFAIFFAVQIALPLRHFLYPGYVSWTEEGHNVAWRMKLRGKSSDALFFASDPVTGSTWLIDNRDYLNRRQNSKMSNRPVMILRFAHHLAGELRAEGYEQIEIRAWVMASLNSRARQLLIDPTVNLAALPYNIHPSDWIVSLMQGPAPAPPNPTLIASRRQDGTLILINATEALFPLSAAHFDMGSVQFSGADFGGAELAGGECVVVLSPHADASSIFPVCNEIGRQVVDLPPEVGTLIITVGADGETTCDGVTCLISLPSAGIGENVFVEVPPAFFDED